MSCLTSSGYGWSLSATPISLNSLGIKHTLFQDSSWRKQRICDQDISPVCVMIEPMTLNSTSLLTKGLIKILNDGTGKHEETTLGPWFRKLRVFLWVHFEHKTMFYFSLLKTTSGRVIPCEGDTLWFKTIVFFTFRCNPKSIALATLLTSCSSDPSNAVIRWY